MRYYTPFSLVTDIKSYSSYSLQMLDERAVIYKK